MTIAEYFKVTDDVSFANVELETDNKMFIDPYLIYVSKDDFSNQCANKIVDYFAKLLKYAMLGDRGNGYKLVHYLQENNELRLGYSKGVPKGRGLGNNKGKELFHILCKSKAIKTGLVADIFDASIMIENVGYDKISDLTTNIIFEDLIKYTQYQCGIHNIPTSPVKLKRPVWCHKSEKWITPEYVELPVYNDKPIILTPQNFVRPYMVYTYNRFYSIEMMPYYEKEALQDPSSGLVKILKRGIVPAKMKIREKHPCTKSNVVDFIFEYPQKYKEYKHKELMYVKESDV